MSMRDRIAKALADLAANPAKVLRGAEPSTPGYAYHATSAERLNDIVGSGKLQTYRPWHGTDQSAWPDATTEKRNYFTPTAENTWQFAPEEGAAALLRLRRDAHPIRTESTGDLYSVKPVPTQKVEYLAADDQWRRLMLSLGLIAPMGGAVALDQYGAQR